MPLVTTTEMFKKAYDGGYAIGAFNVNNMEIVQAITEAAAEAKSPIILQASAGARKYANGAYLKRLVEAALDIYPELPVALHLDHGADFEICKSCIDGGFTSVMIDGSSKPFEENIALAKKVAEYAHDKGVVVEAELGTLAGIEDDVKVSAEDSSYTRPEEVEEFVDKTGVDSLAIAIGTSHGAYKFKPGTDPKLRFDILEDVAKRLPGFHCSSRFFFRSSGICEDYQQQRRRSEGCHRRSGRSASSGCQNGRLQDQHRLRPSSGSDRGHQRAYDGSSGSLRSQTVPVSCKSLCKGCCEAQDHRGSWLRRKDLIKKWLSLL